MYVHRPSIFLLVDLGQNLVVTEQQVGFLADLDRRATVGRDEDLVAGLDAGRDGLAVLIGDAGAGSDNAGLAELLNVLLRDEDTRGGLGLSLDALDKDAVQQGNNILDRLDGSRHYEVGIFQSSPRSN